MKRSASLSLFLAILSVISGYMLSNSSWVGRVGITLFYQQYDFLKTWWKAALVVFGLLIFLYALQSLIQKLARPTVAKTVHVFAIATALTGIYLSYDDFRHTLSHRWMGERFHIGVYLFWLGWVVISLYLLLIKRNVQAMEHNVGMDV